MFLSVVGQERRRLGAAALFRRACVEMLEEEYCVRHNKGKMTRLEAQNSIQTETCKVQGNRFSLASPITTTDHNVACDLGADYVGH